MASKANVKVLNKSPMLVEIGVHTFDYGQHDVCVKNPEFVAHYINTLGIHGLTAEVIAASEAASVKATSKAAAKGE